MLTSLGTLRSQEGNSEEDVDLKMCLSSHSASQLKFSLTYVISVEFQMETLKKKFMLGFPLSEHVNFGDFTLLFCRGQMKKINTKF